MAQNLLSRIFGGGSVYETLNQTSYDERDIEQGNYPFGHESPTDAQSHLGLSYFPGSNTSKFRGQLEQGHEEDVPASLLYEGQAISPTVDRPVSLPDTSARWNPSRETELHAIPTIVYRGVIGPKDRAMWKWANVANLDIFLDEVYNYFLGNGIYSILLSRALNLATLGFVTGFTTYLTGCVDYSKVRTSTKLSEIKIDHCIAELSNSAVFVLWCFTMFWFTKLFQYISDFRTLWNMHNFYLHLLEINEADMQTISWQKVVARLMALRDANPATSNAVKRRGSGEQSKERMDPHDIANRIMRKDNYLVAMFNKDVLDLTVPLPLLRNKPMLTRSLEWNLNLCILSYVFDEQGQVRQAFVKDVNKRRLSDGLRRRFAFAGVMNAIFAPFIVIYLLLLYFFKYFAEYHKNPSSIGSRQYTPYAQWKFREFNELFHIFQKRLNISHEYASKYVSQFPNDKTMQVSRFVSFVAGSFAAVLALASVIDPDLFLGFEITHDRTVLFYLGVFGTLVAISRSLVPEDTYVFDPEASLKQVIEYTHYQPPDWVGKMHSYETKQEFSALYEYKFVIFFEEILSVLLTPLILWFSLPLCSEKIIEFVRDFTVHVDGIGYVCSFAVFDFTKHGNVKFGAAPTTVIPAPQVSNDGKMEKSFLSFKASNPNWIPDSSGSAFLANVAKTATMTKPPTSPTRRRALPVMADSYVATSHRARRGMDQSLSSTVYNLEATQSRYHTRVFPRVVEEDEAEDETDKERDKDKYASNLGESYTSTHQGPVMPESPGDDVASDGVLNLLNQFYTEGRKA